MNKSLVKKIIWMSAVFISVLLIGILLLCGYQIQVKRHYDEQINYLSRQIDTLDTTKSLFQDTLFQGRGYLFYNMDIFLGKIDQNEKLIDNQLNKMSAETDPAWERNLHEDIQEFKGWYFNHFFPKMIQYKKQNNETAIQQLAQDQGGIEKVQTFLVHLESETEQLHVKQKNMMAEKETKTAYSQMVFFLFFIIMITIFLVLLRLFIRQFVIPLEHLASTASQISLGAYIRSFDYTERKDEVGTLSRSFERMVRMLRNSEKELIDQNEELIIQQEELNNQKERLQDALEKAKENEELLIRRNQFINGLINTLDKQELLENIIDSMVHFTKATKGIIALLDENKSVAYHGLAEREVKQFRQTISGSDIVAKLKRTLRPFVIKRDSLAAERGYVTDPYFCCDLILPIFLTDNQLVAVVMVTRVGHEFTEKEIGGFLGFCKQISLSLEKLFMYEETENNRQMVQDILNTVHEGIQLVNEKGRILLINDKLRDMIREEYRPLLQQPSYEWLEVLKEKAEEPEPLISFIKDAMNEKHEEPLIFKLKTDKKQIIQLHAETLYRDKKKFGTIFEYRDITKQYEVDQMKSEFVSTVSHELRTPLSSVLGFTELMLNKELPPQKQRKYLLTISQEATRLTALINDFLDVQRMESGKQTYDKNYCSIKSIIEDVLVIQKVNTAQHDFVVDIQTTNLTVLGDRDKLKQVFSNLLSNAVKYSPDGGNIIIRIREEQARLNIDIVDEGLGIPSEAIPDLFTKFYRIDNTDRRKIGGTGLGLAIVKEIVKAHDGEISVQSKLGKGSTFTVSLPLVSGIGMITRKDSLDESQYRPHIVIIEDDFNLANLLKDELEDNGFYTTHYADGETAVSAVIKNLPDVVVVDLKPEDSIDGWSIIKRLKDNPNTENIPIFISTVLDEREKGNLLGISGYLTKPYQPSRLSNSILQCLLENERKGQIMVPETDRNKNE